MRDFLKQKRERGASIVEFAILAPLLILLLFGIIEFGFLFGQFNELRHAAQEGARWGAVSNPDVDGGGISGSDLHSRVCGAANLPGATINVDADPGSGMSGTNGTVTVTATVAPLTGAPIVTLFLPPALSTTVTFRLEQPAQWAAFDLPC